MKGDWKYLVFITLRWTNLIFCCIISISCMSIIAIVHQPKCKNCGPKEGPQHCFTFSPSCENTNSIEQNCCDCSIISVILHDLQEATSCIFCLFSTGCFNRQLEAVASLVSSQLKPKECRYGVYEKLRQTENAFL